MNIYVTRQVPEIAIKMLVEKGYKVTIGKSTVPLKKKDLLKIASTQEYDAFLTLLTDPIDEDFFITAGPKLRVVSNYAVGFNNISIEAATKHGVKVTNTPGSFSDCIAEHAVAMVFALTTRLVEADTYVRKGKYKGWDPMIFIGEDVSGKTVGLLGAGNIGERFATHMAKGFNCKILYYDVRRNEQIERELGATYFSNPDEVIRQADILSLHVPLLPSTKHMINTEKLHMMKKTAILINTARGPVVDENALVKALQDGVLAGAGIDVYEFEPKLAKGLAKLNNVVLTPHIASARTSARNEMATLAAQNIIDVFEGRSPKGLVLLS
ncbi:MAG: D-glycerate dehydrogenase [bacterium]